MKKKDNAILEKAGLNKNNAKYFIKNFKKFQLIYNKLCRICKIKCVRNSRRPMEDYCDHCQEMIKEVLK